MGLGCGSETKLRNSKVLGSIPRTKEKKDIYVFAVLRVDWHFSENHAKDKALGREHSFLVVELQCHTRPQGKATGKVLVTTNR